MSHLQRRELFSSSGQHHVQHEPQSDSGVHREQQAQEEGRVEYVAADCPDERHAAKNVRVPLREAARLAQVFGLEQPERIAVLRKDLRPQADRVATLGGESG